MTWDGVERRESNVNLKTDVALIKQEVGQTVTFNPATEDFSSGGGSSQGFLSFFFD